MADAPTKEKIDAVIKTLRANAHNCEFIWRGQPGWNENNNFAHDWRKAADLIEALASTPPVTPAAPEQRKK